MASGESHLAPENKRIQKALLGRLPKGQQHLFFSQKLERIG